MLTAQDSRVPAKIVNEQCAATERDLRIDFFRGIALLMVLVDHIETLNKISFVQQWTLRALGFSDGADAFVFLSGYAFGMAYSRRMDRGGFWFSLRRAVRRSIQIYLAYLATLAVVSLLGYGIKSMGSGLEWPVDLDKSISAQVLGGLTMSYKPFAFPILAFYVLVLPYATVLLWLQRKCPLLAWTVSLGLYVATHFLPEVTLCLFPISTGWCFNPGTWQLLYFIGTVIGTKQTNHPQSRWWKVCACSLATAVVLVGLIYNKGPQVWDCGITRIVTEAVRQLPALPNATAPGPLRILHFLSVALLLSVMCGRRSAWLKGIFGRYVVTTGQHSLLVYSLGIVLAYTTMPIFAFLGWSRDAILFVHIDMVLLSVLFATCMNRFTRHPRANHVEACHGQPVAQSKLSRRLWR